MMMLSALALQDTMSWSDSSSLLSAHNVLSVVISYRIGEGWLAVRFSGSVIRLFDHHHVVRDRRQW